MRKSNIATGIPGTVNNTIAQPTEQFPLVSIVIPCRNEEKTIRDCILSLCKQEYPLASMEILVADGRSTDRTREILQALQQQIRQLYIVDNPQIIIPAAMNRAISASHGDIIILLSAHAAFSANYVSQAVKLLISTDADCVGGRVETISSTPEAKTIALAMSSPFGVGDAKFRYSNKEEYVDTAAFGAYKREVFNRIGYFDETLPRNEDDEFNYRLRKSGGKILLSPKISARYHARSSLRALWQQYFGYGKGKVKVAQKHATMMRLRHLIPALFVASVVFLSIGSLFQPVALRLLLFCLGAYVAVSLYFSFMIAKQQGWQYMARLPIAFGILHISYGSGTNIGILNVIFSKFLRKDS